MVQIIGSVAVGLAVASAAVAAPSSSSSAAVPRGADAGSSCPRRDAVNSFIGTGGLGYGYGGVNPGAQMPHGPMRLGPDTTNTLVNIGYRHFSGYNYFDDQIRAFSHTHLVGAGINDLGNFGVMPVRLGAGKGPDDFEDMISWSKIVSHRDFHQSVRGWWSHFNKSSEDALPGEYSVLLETPRVQAHVVAASTLAGAHKYSFLPAASEEDVQRSRLVDLEPSRAYVPAVAFDVCHGAHLAAGITDMKESSCHEASLSVSADLRSFNASVYFNRLRMYMYGEIATTGGALGTRGDAFRWETCSNGDGSRISCSEALTASSSNGMLFSRIAFRPVLANATADVEMRVALSFISADLARANFDAADIAFGKRRFEAIADRARASWCSALDGLSVSPIDAATDADLETLLYSANYRAQLTPTDYTESGGVYLGLDKTVHAAAQERAAKYPSSVASAVSEKVDRFYSDLSLWDTFRTLHPWVLLTDEPMAVGILRSMSEMTAQQDGFPRWVLASVDISCMVGLHGSALALEAGLSGLGKEFDLVGMQKMLVNQSTMPWHINGRTDVEHYMSSGFVSSEAAGDSASHTLTYAYDDFVLAGLSDLVGDTATAESALQRSKNYKNIWSAEKQFMCTRSVSGELQCPRNATSPEAWTLYREGDGLHWTTFVPHDPEGLQALYGSRESYLSNMDMLFERRFDSQEVLGNAAPNPYYWAGNEVDAFAVWMYSFGAYGDCTRTQYWSRNITHVHYSNTAHGIPGNEDYGAMSTWLLFASLGVFPQAGTTNFVIGSPRVRSASLRLAHLDGSSSALKIETVGNSADNVYVSALFVNGKEHRSPFIDRSVLAAPGGCTLIFHMTAEPRSNLCPASA